MPKAKRSQREPKPKPYTKPGKKASVTKKDAPRQPFRFLELPVEIRMRIYDLFCTMPLTDRDSTPPERSWIVKARGNLLLTCRQIHEEFAPHFWQSADIKIYNPRVPTGAPYQELVPRGYGLLAKHIEDFETLFLKTLATYKLQFIRRLEFDTSIQPEYRPERGWGVVDWYGVESLAIALTKHMHNLRSLCEISILEIPPQAKPKEIQLLPNLSSDLQSGAKFSWDLSPEVPYCTRLTYAFLQLGDSTPSVFQNWTLTKTMWMQTLKSQAYAEKSGCPCFVKRTGVTFRKTTSGKLQPHPDLVIPSLIIEWETSTVIESKPT
ncbi:hypothetical protein LTR07_008047 [Exophiala xenobiotica]|nr:hypothetical protein LTR79_000168 [Exophiala xenobiotica]KAK5422903.1 hypothetical protein LTR90_001921 [Exophiala xenobiotica]KAK5495429.1 hypothetical protein LTR26_002045 [Exophiala xenobiotica]KAK5514016.1 hypothetical protein LTR07_008047 [Exophiala xenobiotica]